MRVAISKDRQRLLASLIFNFIAKVPGIVAVFVVLPLLSKDLGTAAYGEVLSALALGATFTLPFGGINAVGRRLMAGAVGNQDRAQQANVFVTTTAFILMAGAATSGLMLATTARTWSNPAFIVISLLPVLAGIFNVFDNIRASYNEYYVTAVFQLVFQTVIYGAIYLFGIPKGGLFLSGLGIQGPYLFASVATLVYLVIQRPFLIGGKIENAWRIVIPAIGVTVADGALTAILNFCVYWLKFAGDPEFAAWVGTLVRLFQSFMSPALLVLFPVTSYISIRWRQMPASRQLVLHRVFLLLGCGYGVLVGGVMAVAGPYYIKHMFKFSAHGDRIDVMALSIFIGAVVAQKTYTMLLYAIAEARVVSFGTGGAAVFAIGAAAVSRAWLPAPKVVDVVFVVMGISLLILLLYSSHRYRQPLVDQSAGKVA